MADTPEPLLAEISRLISSVHRYVDGLFDETTGAGSVLSCAPAIIGNWWREMDSIHLALLRQGNTPPPLPNAPDWMDSFDRRGSLADAMSGEAPDGVTTLRVQEAGKVVLDWCDEAGRSTGIARLASDVHRYLESLGNETTEAGSVLSTAPAIVGRWWRKLHTIHRRLRLEGNTPPPLPVAPCWRDSFERRGTLADVFRGIVPDGVTTGSVQEAGKTVLDWCDEAARSRGDVGTDTPADVGDVTPQEVTPGVYQQLAKWAADKLKGKQRRTVELLAENNGRIEMKDLATDPAIDWKAPFDNQFNSLAKAVNPKLRKIGWRIFRQSNEARAEKWQGQK